MLVGGNTEWYNLYTRKVSIVVEWRGVWCREDGGKVCIHVSSTGHKKASEDYQSGSRNKFPPGVTRTENGNGMDNRDRQEVSVTILFYLYCLLSVFLVVITIPGTSQTRIRIRMMMMSWHNQHHPITCCSSPHVFVVVLLLLAALLSLMSCRVLSILWCMPTLYLDTVDWH